MCGYPVLKQVSPEQTLWPICYSGLVTTITRVSTDLGKSQGKKCGPGTFKTKANCHENLLLFLSVIENAVTVFTNMNVHMQICKN